MIKKQQKKITQDEKPGTALHITVYKSPAVIEDPSLDQYLYSPECTS